MHQEDSVWIAAGEGGCRSPRGRSHGGIRHHLSARAHACLERPDQEDREGGVVPREAAGTTHLDLIIRNEEHILTPGTISICPGHCLLLRHTRHCRLPGYLLVGASGNRRGLVDSLRCLTSKGPNSLNEVCASGTPTAARACTSHPDGLPR